MVHPQDSFLEVPCELNLGRDDDPAFGRSLLTEGGELTVRFEPGDVEPRTPLFETWQVIEGVDTHGRNIRMNKVTTNRHKNGYPTKLTPQSVHIFENKECTPANEEQVVIDFDTLCFQTQIPPRNQLDADTKDNIEKIDESEDLSMPNVSDEFELLYIEDDDYEVCGVPLVDTTDRIDIIKDNGQLIRTGKIRVKQYSHGDLTYRTEKAAEVVNKVLELTQLVQEVTPRYVRRKVVSIDGSSIENIDTHYEVLNSGSTANLGARFAQFPDKVLWADFHEYIEAAYRNYTPNVREGLHLRQILGYYVDARDPNRAVEGKMLSVCSAIELLALWHAREDGVSEKTAPKIKHLVDKLDIETEDLAQHVVDDPNQLDVPEYFWQRSRNYVSHGDPDVSMDELIASYESALILLKRIIRNQLLGADNDSFEDFYSMEPRPSIEFGD